MDSQESSPTSQFKSTNSSALNHLYGPTLISIQEYWKNHSIDYMGLCQQSNVWFFFNMLFRFVKVFLPRRKHLLITWWQSLCTVILEPKEIKSVTVSVVSQSIYHKVKGLDSMILVFECWVLSQLFHSLLSPSSRGSLFFFAFCHKGGVICIAEVIGVFPRNLDSSSCFTQASISHYVLCM